MTTAPTTTAPLFAAFADLVTSVRRPRRRPTIPAGLGADNRDRQRLLDDLRALNDAPADIALR